MTGEITMERLSESYPDLLDAVRRQGRDVQTRLGPSKEIVGMGLRLFDPEHCVIGRSKFSRDFMDAEIMQLLAGRYDHDLLAAKVPRAADLITQATAYGPRVCNQLARACAELDQDWLSRRAVVYVGRQDDLARVRGGDPAVNGEMPCTMTWQFLLREDGLHMIVAMRSWDLVWGLSYDVPSFVAAQMAVAAHLEVELGTYCHMAGSAHVYHERDREIVAWPNVDDGELEVPWIGGKIWETVRAANEAMQNEREALA